MNGNAVSNGSVNSYNYKSTIIKNETVKDILKEVDSSDLYWYRDIEDGNWSVAVDDLTEREALASSEKGCVSKTDKNNGDCTTDGVSYFCENSFAFHDCVKGEYF